MKNKFLFCIKILAFTLIATNRLVAQDTTKVAPLNINGAVDMYYQYNFNGVSSSKTAYTEKHNSFTLGMANLMFSKEQGKVGFMADLTFGPRADASNGYPGTTIALIKQMYVTYKPNDKLKFTFGNFVTHIGYELIGATDNLNYSMSYMFSYGPYFHTGLKAEYALTSKLTAMLGVFNDTDKKFDFNNPKHIGGQLAYLDGNFKGYLNYLGGVEAQNPNNVYTRNQIDLVASYQIDKTGLGLNLTANAINTAAGVNNNWAGAAFYANYAVSDKFLLAGRYEYFSDSGAIIFNILNNEISSFTLSGNIKLGALTLIPEFRIDSSSRKMFDNNTGIAQSNTTSGLLMAAVYKF